MFEPDLTIALNRLIPAALHRRELFTPASIL
jgi:hypothetical protein